MHHTQFMSRLAHPRRLACLAAVAACAAFGEAGLLEQPSAKAAETPAAAADMRSSRDDANADASASSSPNGTQSEATLADARRLVQQLGDSSLQQRDAASRQLVQLGTAAIEAANEGLRHPDAEVRRRCRQILESVYRRVHEQQLAEFLENPQRDVSLPGWNRFQETVGSDASARGLFVDIQRAEPSLLRLAEQDGRRLAERVEDRCRELYQELDSNFGREQPVSVDSVAALMFLTAGEEARPTAETIARLQRFALQQVFRHAVTSGPRKDALKTLVAAWLEATTEQAELLSHVRLALTFEIAAGAKAAWKLLEQANVAPDRQLLALLAIGRFGTPQDIPKLQRYVDEKGIVFQQQRGNRVVQTQLRDVALAVLIHLADENLADYGLAHVEKSSDTLYQPTSIYFESDEARVAAIEKWRTRAEQ